MVVTQKLYPRGTVKRVVKAHANRNVSKNADILVSHFRIALLHGSAVDLLCFWVDLPGLYAFYARVSRIHAFDAVIRPNDHWFPHNTILARKRPSDNVLRTCCGLQVDARVVDSLAKVGREANVCK